MAQTKADRTAAGKKAAATRTRNKQKADNKSAGQKAATTRFTNDTVDGVKKAGANAGRVGKAAGGAAINAGRSVASRVGIGGKKK